MTWLAAAPLGIEPIVPARRWEVLSSPSSTRLREAIFAVLADVGVRFPLPRALECWRPTAPPSTAPHIARLPRPLVERGAGGRTGRGSRCAAATRPSTCRSMAGSATCPTTRAAWPWSIRASGERRASTLADVADSARFCDALPQMAFAWGPIVAAGDTPVGPRALHEAAAVLTNTTSTSRR